MATTRGNQKEIQQQQIDMEYQQKLKRIDDEFMSFYQYCQEAGFSEAEMDMIVAPLVATLRKRLMKKLAKVFGAMFTIVTLCYCAIQLGSASMHCAALGRLFMIKARI
jgi:deoxyadenosine/deoxycytidine kinase